MGFTVDPYPGAARDDAGETARRMRQREVEMWSSVGDWIWLQFGHGKLAGEVSAELIAHVDELMQRWVGK